MLISVSQPPGRGGVQRSRDAGCVEDGCDERRREGGREGGAGPASPAIPEHLLSNCSSTARERKTAVWNSEQLSWLVGWMTVGLAVGSCCRLQPRARWYARCYRACVRLARTSPSSPCFCSHVMLMPDRRPTRVVGAARVASVCVCATPCPVWSHGAPPATALPRVPWSVKSRSGRHSVYSWLQRLVLS